MTFKLWDRWAPSLGILTVVCWALAFAVAGSNPSILAGSAGWGCSSA